MITVKKMKIKDKPVILYRAYGATNESEAYCAILTQYPSLAMNKEAVWVGGDCYAAIYDVKR